MQNGASFYVEWGKSKKIFAHLTDLLCKHCSKVDVRKFLLQVCGYSDTGMMIGLKSIKSEEPEYNLLKINEHSQNLLQFTFLANGVLHFLVSVAPDYIFVKATVQ